MKHLINITFVLVVSVFFANVCMVGDVEDIIKTTKAHFATQNAGDAKAHMAHHMPNSSAFAPNGGLLIVN